MVWKALEALGMLSEALGSFDVNTVCPLPGSWINHVTVFGDRLARFDCIFTGFADNRLWECRIFSFTKACLAQTSRVFFC